MIDRLRVAENKQIKRSHFWMFQVCSSETVLHFASQLHANVRVIFTNANFIDEMHQWRL